MKPRSLRPIYERIAREVNKELRIHVGGVGYESVAEVARGEGPESHPVHKAIAAKLKQKTK